MAAQVEAGHEVAHFCAGRRLPMLRSPRLHRWKRAGVEVHEMINPPVPHGGDLGTRVPQLDLSEPYSERLFRRVLANVRPDVVHVQELAGLPSSILDTARESGVPVVMTLHDYLPLCPTLKLYDWQGQICRRREPGADCRRCCRDGSLDASHHADQTIAVALVQFGNRFPRIRDLYRNRVAPPLWRAIPDRAPAPAGVSPGPPPAAVYDERRRVNVDRLGRVDALLAVSDRVAEIYAELGVSTRRLRTLRMTVRQLEQLTPRELVNPPRPVRFAALNGASSPQKGSELLRDAVRRLEAGGYAGGYRLVVHGAVEEAFARDTAHVASVEVHAMYDQSSLNTMLDEVDVGIVPSTWEEAYGLVGPEFLAKGIPVIGNDIGGVPEYTLPGLTGWRNTSNDGAGLATLMARVIDRPDEIVALHRRIVSRRSGLLPSMARHVEALDEVYGEVLAGADRRD